MTKLIVSLVVLGCIVTLFVGFSSPSRMHIGTDDSRAFAIAVANSNEGMEFVANLRAEWTKAKVANNDSLIRQVENKGGVHQVLNHLRAFSVGSVADILEKHKAEVELLAREAKVEVIVSKFELIYSSTSVDTVDVTLPIRVLEQCGFVCVGNGKEAGTIIFRLNREDFLESLSRVAAAGRAVASNPTNS